MFMSYRASDIFFIATIFSCVFLFSLSSVFLFFQDIGWHDQQRIFQLALICVAVLFLLVVVEFHIPKWVIFLISIIFFMGFVSSLVSSESSWALKEWARYVGFFILIVVLAGLMGRFLGLQYLLLGLMAAVATYHSFNYCVTYVAVFISGYFDFDPDLFYTGFVNPRFFGQFQVLVVPVLSLSCFFLFFYGCPRVAVLVFFILAVQWSMLFMLGSRGALASIVVAQVALLFLGRRYFQFVFFQFVSAFVGFLFFYVLFRLVPRFLVGYEGFERSVIRGGISSRDVLWGDAWDMFRSNMILGVGPMHFSSKYNSIAAHPHQVVLQWLAEWGVVATVLVAILVFLGLLRGCSFVRGPDACYVDASLFASVVGALSLAQIDGVFVMPYTETWLAIIVSICFCRWRVNGRGGGGQRIFLLVLSVPVVIVLGRVLILEAPYVATVQDSYLQNNPVGLKPRFWSQGWIPMETAQ